MNEEISLLEADDVSNKSLVSPLFNYNLLGLPNSYSGVDRKGDFTWNKKGVALAYMIVPVLKSAVDLIAENLASVPIVLKNKEGNVVHRTDMSGAATNDFLSAIEKSYKYYGMPIIQLWATSLLLYGENYIEKVSDIFKRPANLKWLNPLAVDIDLQVKELISPRFKNLKRYVEVKKYRYTSSHMSTTYSEDEIIFSRDFNPIDDVRGYSKALSALGKANITMEFDSFTMAFYNNAGHPGVIISPKDKLVGTRDIASWQDEWNKKYRGSQQQFKTHISSFPFDVETFEILDISKPLEVSSNAENHILKALKVPSIMLGGNQEGGHQFSKETKNSFMQTVVKPLGLSISNSINHSKIVEEFGEVGLKFGFDFSQFENVAKTDMDRQTVLQNQVQSGAISIGDYQEKIGATVIEGSKDIYMMPQGFVVVKKEDIVQPENLPNPNDQTGPDENRLNQSERVTQSETEDQDTTEFYGSKSWSEEFDYMNDYPKKYNSIDFNIPAGAKKFFNIESEQVKPSEVENIVKKIDVNKDINEHQQWAIDLYNQMEEASKKEHLKSINLKKIFEIAENKNVSLNDALDMIEELKNDY